MEVGERTLRLWPRAMAGRWFLQDVDDTDVLEMLHHINPARIPSSPQVDRDDLIRGLKAEHLLPEDAGQARVWASAWYAAKIVDGEIEPYVGAKKIAQLYAGSGADSEEIDLLTASYSEWEDAPAYRSEYEDEMRRAAQAILESAGA
jgi:hypothetical protein